MDVLKRIYVNIPLLEAPKEARPYWKFLRKLLTKKGNLKHWFVRLLGVPKNIYVNVPLLEALNEALS